MPVETVANVTVTAYTPFTQGRKFGPRTHYVDGWLCHVREWEENLNPKIAVFRYEKVGRQPKKRGADDGAQDANKKKEPSFDPRSAAAGLLVTVPDKSRAEIAKEKEARYLEKRARERREAAARRTPARRTPAAKANDSLTSEEELLRALPRIAVQPMPWQSKSGVSSSGVRHSRPARLTGPPPKKPESIEE